ncbi:PKD domain-containing protein [Stieleria varia]|uniref:PKD domain protein n=1 Tax=Stieleria varia TaxID=2528005 RepID=A0A5C6ASP6_9BACT|nr:PKD domain-containing protein [Stieleria varia]TWU02299.1 PKD domain protein [Stieleria varia]
MKRLNVFRKTRRKPRLFAASAPKQLTIENLETRHLLAAGDLLATLESPSLVDDGFSRSVAMSGNIAVVGAYRSDGNVGSAYLYDLNSPGNRVEIPNPAANGNSGFGWDVALDGSNLVIGAAYDDTGALGTGRVHVYHATSSSATFQTSINNPSPNSYDRFGWSVAVDGNTVVIGAPADDFGARDSGAAYVFDISGGTATLVSTIVNPTPELEDRFGERVTVSGNKVAISAPSSNGQALGSDPGFVYVYDLSSGDAVLQATIQGDDEFGVGLALDGNTLVAGNGDGAGVRDVKIYDISGTGAVLVDTVSNPEGTVDYFGRNVSLDGNYLAIAADKASVGERWSGTVHFYDISSGVAVLQQTLDNPTPITNEFFGLSIAVDGGRALVGAEFDRIDTTNHEVAYVYEIGAPEFDFGDAGSTYPTTILQDGARHIPVGPQLGAYRDAEFDNIVTSSSNGDDLNGAADDEDGVTFQRLTAGQQQASLGVDVRGGNAKLDAWIDFNADGDWDDSGERIANSILVGNAGDGTYTITFNVPANAVIGNTQSRFRLSTIGGLSPRGIAPNGEVEDHAVTIYGTPSLTAAQPSVSVPEGNTATNSGTFSHSGSAAWVTVTASIGTINQGNGATGSWAWSLQTTSGSLTEGSVATDTVTITATDPFGATSTLSFPLIVTNSPPVIDFDDSEIAITQGQTAAKSLTITDVASDVISVSASLGTVSHSSGNTWIWSYQSNDPMPTTAVVITATDSDNAARSVGFDLTVDAVEPTVNAGSDLTGSDGQVLSFAGSVSDAPAGVVPSYHWDFGDGSVSSTRLANHTYSDNGVYTATLSVTFGQNTYTDTLVVNVANVPASFAPQADESLTASVAGAFTREISFTDPGDDVWSGTVFFGDGSTAQPITIDPGTKTFLLEHTYASAGTYTVNVSLRDDDTNSADAVSRTFNVTVVIDAPPPIPTETQISLDANGNLVITDTGNNTNDHLTISTTASTIQIHDPSVLLGTSINGATGNSTHTVNVPLSAVQGKVLIRTGAGDDTIELVVSPGWSAGHVEVDGGDSGAVGDRLILSGGPFVDASFASSGVGSGSVELGQAFRMDHLNLEQVHSELIVNDVSVTFSNVAESIDINDLGGGQLGLDSSNGVDTRMSIPTRSLLIDLRGSGDDRLIASAESFAAISNVADTVRVLADRDDELNLDPSFQITGTEVIDGMFHVVSQSGSAIVRIAGSEWTNPLNPLDVNGQSGTTALDALIIINELQNGRYISDPLAKDLVSPQSVSPFPGFFLDTSGDGRISAFDALLVINGVPTTQPEGEGIGVSVPLSLSQMGSDESGRDESQELTGPTESVINPVRRFVGTWIAAAHSVDAGAVDAGTEDSPASPGKSAADRVNDLALNELLQGLLF